MIDIKSAAEKQNIGILSAPPIPCPNCGRRTRAEDKCQYKECGRVWSLQEKEWRKEKRIEFYNNRYTPHIQNELKRRGLYDRITP